MFGISKRVESACRKKYNVALLTTIAVALILAIIF